VDTSPIRDEALTQPGRLLHITTPKQYADLLVEGLVSHAAFLKMLKKS
jgi:hypothetical protein